MDLKELKKQYRFGSYILSATQNCKTPLRIGVISEAKHEDRATEIRNIQEFCLDLWRVLNPTKPKDCFKKLIPIIKNNSDFAQKVKEQIERMNYLKQLPRDIVNSEGGLIYCGETNVYAEIVEK